MFWNSKIKAGAKLNDISLSKIPSIPKILDYLKKKNEKLEHDYKGFESKENEEVKIENIVY